MPVREPHRLHHLTREAARLDEIAAATPERGAAILTAGAGALRTVAEIYALDPTMADCPIGRARGLDLVEEIVRQLRPLVGQAVDGRNADRWPIEARWEEAEALAGRLPVHLERARALARPDHDTPEGSQAISRMRLEAASGYIRRVGEQLLSGIQDAADLPYPDPEVAELAAIAKSLAERAARLAEERDVTLAAIDPFAPAEGRMQCGNCLKAGHDCPIVPDDPASVVVPRRDLVNELTAPFDLSEAHRELLIGLGEGDES